MRIHWILAGVALVLGVGAAIVGSPYRPTSPVDQLVSEIELGADRVTPVALARMLRAREDGLQIVDLRDEAAFNDFTVPMAERVELSNLVDRSFNPAARVVLVSADGVRASQGWALLRMSGHHDVVVLDGGVEGWIRTVLTPAVPIEPSEEEQAYWDERIELAEYFGGSARRVPSGDPAIVATWTNEREAATRVRRLVHEGRELGCGW